MGKIREIWMLAAACSNFLAVLLKRAMPHLPFPGQIRLRSGERFVIERYIGNAELSILLDVWSRKVYNPEFLGDIQEGDTVLDVGANKGYFTVFAAGKAKAGKVYAIEPYPPVFRIMEKNVRLNGLENVVGLNLGLWSHAREVNLYTTSNVGGHSLYAKPSRVGKVRVRTATLAQVCRDHGIGQIDFLKIDAEGAEFDIILGLDPATIQKIRKVALETHDFGRHRKEMLVEFLQSHGFNTLSQGDYLYARQG